MNEVNPLDRFVSALYVAANGPYSELPGVDVWDSANDCRYWCCDKAWHNLTPGMTKEIDMICDLPNSPTKIEESNG